MDVYKDTFLFLYHKFMLLGLHHLSSISSLQFSPKNMFLISEYIMEALKNLFFHHEEVRPEIICWFHVCLLFVCLFKIYCQMEILFPIMLQLN